MSGLYCGAGNERTEAQCVSIKRRAPMLSPPRQDHIATNAEMYSFIPDSSITPRRMRALES